VGFSTDRGDSLSVRAMEFHHSDLEDGVKAPEIPVWRRFLPYIAGALVVLAAVVVLVRRTKTDKRLAQLKTQVALKGAEHAVAAALEPGLGEERRSRLLEPAPTAIADFRARALELAGKDPATASVVLKGWLSQASEPRA